MEFLFPHHSRTPAGRYRLRSLHPRAIQRSLLFLQQFLWRRHPVNIWSRCSINFPWLPAAGRDRLWSTEVHRWPLLQNDVFHSREKSTAAKMKWNPPFHSWTLCRRYPDAMLSMLRRQAAAIAVLAARPSPWSPFVSHLSNRPVLKGNPYIRG